MGYAKYVGRIGALALALGIGTAVANPAWADSGTGESGNQSPTTSENSSPSNDSQNTTSQNDDPDNNTGSGKNTQDADEFDGDDGDDGDEFGAEVFADSEPEPELVEPGPEDSTEDETVVISEEIVVPEAVVPEVVIPEIVVPEVTVPEVVGDGPASGQPAGNPPAPLGAVDTQTAPAPQTLQQNDGVDPESRLDITDPDPDPDLAAVQYFSLSAETDNVTDPAVLAAASVGTPAPAPVVQQPKSPIGVLLGGPVALLKIAGQALNMLFHPAPSTPGDPPLLLGVLAFVRREIQRTFFNSSPHAVADVASTSEEVPTTITVLANDTDPNLYPGGDVLTITKYTQAANGTVVLNPDGTFGYTPNAGFSGTDTFTYTVSDEASPWHVHGLLGMLFGGGHGSTATVSVAVNAVVPVNNAPEPADDAVDIAEDAATTHIDVLANDTDPDGDPLSVVAVGTPANGGTVAINPDGTIAYTPATDFNGIESFTYTVSDGVDEATATVTVTVAPVDDAPIANDDAVSTDEDAAVTIDPAQLLANDEGDDLLVTIVDSPANGTLTANADGTFTYTPDENFNGTDAFTYVAANSATSNTAVVTITVNAVNDDPTLAPDAPTTNAVTGIVTADLHGADIDGDTLTFEASTPARGSVTFTNGVFTYTPTDEARAAVAQGGPATDTFTVTVSDGNGGTASQTFTVPIASNIDNITIEIRWGAEPVDLDSHLTGPTTAGDGRFHVYFSSKNYYDTSGGLAANLAADDTTSFGPELTTIYNRTPGDYLFYVHNYAGDSSLAASQATVTVRDTVSGIDRQFDISPAATGRYWSVFKLNISDTGIVTITPIDEYGDTPPTLTGNAPVAGDDALSTNEDIPLTITAAELLSNDTDSDSDTLAVIINSYPTNGSLTPDGIGTFTYTPNADYSGVDTFTITVSDGNGGTTDVEVNVPVTILADTPVTTAVAT